MVRRWPVWTCNCYERPLTNHRRSLLTFNSRVTQTFSCEMSATHFSIQSWSRRSNVESTLTWFPYLIFSQFQQKRNADIDFEWANQFKKKPPLSSNLHITKMNVIHVSFSQQFQQFLFPNLKSLNSLVLVIGGISREKGLATFLREWTDNNQIVSLYRTIGQRGKENWETTATLFLWLQPAGVSGTLHTGAMSRTGAG